MAATEHYIDLDLTTGLEVDYDVRVRGFGDYNAQLTLQLMVEHVETDYPEIIYILPPFISGVKSFAIEDPRRCPALAKVHLSDPTATVIPQAHGELAFYRPQGGSEPIQILVAVDVSSSEVNSVELAWADLDLSLEGNNHILNPDTGTRLKPTGNQYGELF